MSGFQDVRDVMDLPSESTPRAPPAKKQKTVERRPDGITRELFALLGENPPPVAIVENKFKDRPRWMGKVTPWVWKGFTNPARTDDLVLHHWERASSTTAAGAASDNSNPNDSSLSYRFSKFNVKVDIPTYTDGEYEVLKDPDWTREETDYLFTLCREYDLRFLIIWDRYDFPCDPPKPRSVEDIKARYYSVCRSLLELRTPLNMMTPEETQSFALLSFDKEREIARKKMANVLFERTPQQVKEEEMLLTEFARIVRAQQKALEERKDLFARLEAPPSQGSITAYTGSQGLAHLRDMMLSSSDKNKKRKSLAIDTTHSPVVPIAPQKDTPLPKKQVRKLTSQEELQFGVTRFEKLSSGVKFRSAMVATNVKGGTAQKVQQALAQLEISTRLAMPTARTVARFEQLQAAVGALLDAKKALDKIENELRVVRAQQDLLRDES